MLLICDAHHYALQMSASVKNKTLIKLESGDGLDDLIFMISLSKLPAWSFLFHQQKGQDSH